MFQLIVFYFLFSSIYANDLTPIVKISNGPIQGKFVNYQDTKVAEFLGIPFAKPPVGPLRFQLPVKPDDWTDVKSTVNFGASCPQKSQHIKPSETNEDCLFLNVYATQSTFNSSSTRLRPVLFWIHGGALAQGSGNEFYDGIPMVPLHDVVLVTHNYRLNAFGFMYFGDKEPRIPANIGFKDQILALQWVKENIAKFGGDPDQVTIFGQSAGSMSVSAHILSPLSKGLFKRAILESGTIMNPKDDPAFFVRNALILLNRTSCVNSNDILTCLQGLPVSEIIENQSSGILSFRWTFGDDFLPYTPMEAFSQGLFDNSFDILLGTEKNEFSIFMSALDPVQFNPIFPAPLDYQKALGYLSLIFQQESLDFYRELYFGSPTNDSNYLRSQIDKAYSEVTLFCPTYMFGLKYSSKAIDNNKEGKVYGYYHTQKPAKSWFQLCDISPWMGTCHGGELSHVFGLPFIESGYPKKDIDLSREMMKIWTQFAEFGHPPTVGGTEWKPLSEESSAMILNVDDLGKVEKSRIEFCVQQWEGFVTRGSLQLQYLLAAV